MFDPTYKEWYLDAQFMHLKSLVGRGFKTFADRTEIDFSSGQGIIAIVGPNGCGKSNIVDALRFVFGEQNMRDLRGQTLHELIFAGTAHRKALSMAEVVLTLDNADHALKTDYTEVAIKRRIFRSGESEFYINNVPVRLRDIRELFMDTGLGSNAYSIIGQGQVDAMLSAKPEERRAIFEEAAGIAKYRYRKRSAERKLIATEQNLLRLHDLRSELTAQLKTLEEQAARAKEYQEIKTRLREQEIGMCQRLVTQLTTRKQELDAQVDTLRQEVSATEQVSIAEEGRRDQLRLELNTCEDDLEKCRKQIQDAKDRLATFLRDQQVEDERGRYLSERLGALRQEVDSLQDRIVASETETVEQQGKLTGIQTQETEMAQALAAVQGIWDRVEADRQQAAAALEESRSKLFDREHAITTLRSDSATCESQIRLLNTRREQDADTLRRLQVEAEGLAGKKEALTAAVARYRAEEEELINRIADIQSTIRGFDASLTRLKEEFQSTKEQADKKTSELSVLREMNESFEGYGEGLRDLLQLFKSEPGRFAGVRGALADLIQPDPAYATAIEAALGDALQALVVDDAAAAERVLDVLDERSFSRLTILIRSEWERRTNAFMDNVPGLGRAADHVTCDSSLRDFINGLLGRTLIASDRRGAAAIRESWKRHGEPMFRIVTQRGDVFEPTGVITAGRATRRRLLGRGQDMAEMDTDVKRLSTRVGELEAEQHQIHSEMQMVTSRLTATIDKKQRLEIERVTAERRLDEIQDQDTNLQRGLDTYQKSVDSLDRELAELSAQRGRIDASVALAVSERQEWSDKVDEAGGKVVGFEARREELLTQLTEVRVRHTEVLGNLRQLQDDLARRAVELDELKRTQTIRRDEAEGVEMKLRESYAHVAEIQEAWPMIDQDKISQENRLAELALTKREIQGQLTLIEEQLKSQTGEGRGRREQLTQMEISLAKIDGELSSLVTRMQEEWGLTIEEVLAATPDVKPRETSKAEVERMRTRLAQLEPVNLMAIDEVVRVQERLTQMDTQVTDLTEARTNLEKLIAELDSTARTQFLETLRIVEESFQKLFGMLFEGGEAKITLSGAGDVLDGGIEIVARPHGKRWLSLSLLSGGERSLTALALLFALQSSKPSPFCFLDEVDAALDEANVARFGNLLRAFSQKCQMLVITHNKKTMAEADLLYGVTMEEPGVSKIVSMKMEAAHSAGS